MGLAKPTLLADVFELKCLFNVGSSSMGLAKPTLLAVVVELLLFNTIYNV